MLFLYAHAATRSGAAEVPGAKASDRNSCFGFGDELLDQQLPPDHGQDLGVEVFWDPTLGIDGHQSGECPAPTGASDDLGTGRSVDDERRHSPASTRSSRSASEAASVSSSGSGPDITSSSRRRNASGEVSSSGFVTTTSGPSGTSEA